MKPLSTCRKMKRYATLAASRLHFRRGIPQPSLQSGALRHQVNKVHLHHLIYLFTRCYQAVAPQLCRRRIPSAAVTQVSSKHAKRTFMAEGSLCSWSNTPTSNSGFSPWCQEGVNFSNPLEQTRFLQKLGSCAGKLKRYDHVSEWGSQWQG